MYKINSKKAFTLAECLIVVAVVAVLVAISIPIFRGQLEKSREAADLSNVRSAYATVSSAAITEDMTSNIYDSSQNMYILDVPLKQKEEGWKTSSEKLMIGDISYDDKDHWINDPKENGACKVYYIVEKGEIYIDWSGEGSSPSAEKIDYSSNTSVGMHIFKEVQKELDLYNANNQNNPDFYKAFHNNGVSVKTTVTLPNGQEVTVYLYNRDYDKFQDKPTRLSSGSAASFIYNRETGRLSTVICFNGSNYSSWTKDSDYDNWKNDSTWKEDDY